MAFASQTSTGQDVFLRRVRERFTLGAQEGLDSHWHEPPPPPVDALRSGSGLASAWGGSGMARKRASSARERRGKTMAVTGRARPGGPIEKRREKRTNIGSGMWEKRQNSGGWSRSSDLWVMGPTRCPLRHAASNWQPFAARRRPTTRAMLELAASRRSESSCGRRARACMG